MGVAMISRWRGKSGAEFKGDSMNLGRSKRATPPPSTMTAGSDLILDTALRAATQDRFDHEAIAHVVADLTLNVTPPVNIALFGPWGSGKSSFFGLLNERLTGSGRAVKAVRYDAWKYGGRALKKHFVGSIADQLGVGGDEYKRGLAHDQEVTRLDLWTWAKKNKGSLAVGAGLAIGITIAWFVLISLVVWAVDRDGFGAATKVAVTSVGTVLSLSFAALLFGPKVLESAVVKVRAAAPETDDEFATSFQNLVDNEINISDGERLVVFIDELDRCSPKDVVATLIDLKTFLDVKGCIFIVAADREVLERSLGEVPQANPIRDEDPYYSTPGAFIDKIFQHQVPLPPLRPQALTRFARELVQTQDGLWADLRATEPDDRLFLRVVYALVPVHVRSPRRVKVLLNNYATNVRVAEARGINWIDRATELACLTVLETEFPAVAADLVRIPRLLAYLRGEDCSTASKEVSRVVAGYSSGARAQGVSTEGAAYDAQAAGALLVDQAADPSAKDRANRVLNAHLRSYLRKIAAQDIPDPRPDLFYLQSAGQNDGLTDPALGYAIDFAADLAATDVVEAFADQLSATVAAGVRLLVQQAEAERGPGRTNIIEAACRLVERLDRDDLEAVAPVAVGGVLAEVDGADWSREATPGALLLGVMGTRSDLVSRLLERDSASDFAKDGLLSRLSRVLAFANDHQAALVHDMLGNAYYRYPQPVHDALSNLPPTAALRLWVATETYVDVALTDLAPKSDATVSSARATPATVEDKADDEPEDTDAERYAALLSAVESRSDDAGALVSHVLEIGQRSDYEDVQATVREREVDALSTIADPARLNLHAMLGIARAPVGDASFWAEKLSDADSDPAQALGAFTRIVNALDQASAEDHAGIAESTSALIPHMTEAQAPKVRAALTAAVDAFDWTDSDQAKQRAIVQVIASDARPILGDAEVDDLLAVGLTAGLHAAGTSDAFVEEAVNWISRFTVTCAVRFEELVESGTESPLATLRLRIAAASRTGATITAAEVIAVKDEEGFDAAPLSEWLALRPTLAEAMSVVGRSMKVYRQSLGAYATALNREDRTTFWIHCEQQGFSPTALSAVGAAGVSSAAIQHIATEVADAKQQAKRDDLVARLLRAKLSEQPAHATATMLVEQLLATDINGNAALAAKIAIASGGAAYRRVVAVRDAFDRTVMRRPQAISKGDQGSLREINLLSRPKKIERNVAKALKGTVDKILGN